MHATAIREGARVAALIVVLALAAVLGLAVGNALNGRSSGDVGAPAAGAALELSDYGQRHAAAALADGPEQTDPRPHIWAEIDDVASDASLTRPTPR